MLDSEFNDSENEDLQEVENNFVSDGDMKSENNPRNTENNEQKKKSHATLHVRLSIMLIHFSLELPNFHLMIKNILK